MIIHECEQRSEAWYALRLGMPTASEFSKIVTSAGEPSKSRRGYAISLAAEVYAGGSVDTWGGNVHLERGKTLEEDAIRQYEFINDVSVDPIGFITDDDVAVGCSPDGLVGKVGMVEVKCLKAENHIEAMIYNQKHGRAPTTYVPQTQGQLWVTGREWCDLVFYHPKLPPLVIRQTPDAAVFAGLEAGVPALLLERDEVVAMLRAA